MKGRDRFIALALNNANMKLEVFCVKKAGKENVLNVQNSAILLKE